MHHRRIGPGGIVAVHRVGIGDAETVERGDDTVVFALFLQQREFPFPVGQFLFHVFQLPFCDKDVKLSQAPVEHFEIPGAALQLRFRILELLKFFQPAQIGNTPAAVKAVEHIEFMFESLLPHPGGIELPPGIPVIRRKRIKAGALQFQFFQCNAFRQFQNLIGECLDLLPQIEVIILQNHIALLHPVLGEKIDLADKTGIFVPQRHLPDAAHKATAADDPFPPVSLFSTGREAAHRRDPQQQRNQHAESEEKTFFHSPNRNSPL